MGSSPVVLYSLAIGLGLLLGLPSCGLAQSVATLNNSVWYSDDYSNQVWGNGTIQWGPVPIPGTYSTSNSYETTMLLSMLFEFARSFVNTVMPGDFPWDFLKPLLQGNIAYLTQNYMTIVMWLLGFAICLVIGILFILIMPLCGCCFCCCRCCGNCGGDLVQEYDESADCKRMGLGLAIFLMALCMGVAGFCMWMTNEQFTVTMNAIDVSVANNLNDIDLYLNFTGQQFRYLAVNMYSIVNVAIQGDLNKTGDIVGTSILSAFQPYIDPTVKAVVDLDVLLNNIYPLLVQADAQMAVLRDAGDNMTLAMNNLGIAMQNTKSVLGCNVMCQAFPASGLITASVDFSSLPNLTDTINNVGTVAQQNLTGLVTSALGQVNQIPALVYNATQGMTGTISSLLNNFAVTISSMVDGLLNQTSQAFNVADYKAQTSNFFTQAKSYDRYRWYGGMGLMALFCLLVLLILMSLCSGCAGYKDVLPTKRGGMSNLGGCCLMVAVFLMFLTSFLLMLLTTITFVLGGNLEKICQSLIDLSFITEIIDSGAIPNFNIGSELLGNPNFTLSLTNIMLGCRANMAPWTLMSFNSLLDLDYYLNYTNFLPYIDREFAQFDNLSIGQVSFLDSTTEAALIGFRDSGAGSINYTAFYDTLNASTIPSSMSGLKLTINQTRDNCTLASVAFLNYANHHYPDWVYIEDTLAVRVDVAKADLMSTLQSLENYTNNLTPVTNATLYAARDAESVLQTGMTAAILNASTFFRGRILGYVDQFVIKARDVVYNELGACLPVWNLYESFTTVFCSYFVDNLNGFWFGLGWGLFFYVPAIIVCVKLSKHYRRMKDCKGYDDDFDDFGSDSSSSSSSSSSSEDDAPRRSKKKNRVSPA